MGLLQDLLKEVPLSAVLQERVKLAEDRLAEAAREIAALKQRNVALEEENSSLRAAVPRAVLGPALSADTQTVLVHLFRARDIDDRDVEVMSHALNMEVGVLKYHLDRLQEAGFADVTGSNYDSGNVYWALSPAGRRYVVDNKLV